MKTKKADITFYSTITIDTVVIENVLCRLHLPLKITDSIEFNFQPTEEQTEIIRHLPFWRYSLKGEVKDFQGKTKKIITSDVVISTSLFMTRHSNDLSESPFTGEPEDLTVIDFFNGSEETEKIICNYWITPHPMLRPAFHSQHIYTGEVKINIARSFNFDLDNGVRLNFENYYKNYKNEEGDNVSFYELVAKFEKDGQTNDSSIILETLKKLDDILLLASFAARKRCVCVGWHSYDSKSLVKKYLKSRTIPKDVNESWDRQGSVIDLSKFDEFMKTVFSNFQNYIDVEAFRRTLGFVIPSKEDDMDVEGNFIILYAALEMIVLHFRRKNEIELILKKNKFGKFKENIGKYIDELDFSKYLEESVETENLEGITLNKKSLIKEKLSELNRISFKTAFDEFCNYYSADLSDLWSVTGGKGSLSDIRNKLVHGEHFDNELFTALIDARDHLRWTVERMILAILGWSVEQSYVSPITLRQWRAYSDWQESQLKFK